MISSVRFVCESCPLIGPTSTPATAASPQPMAHAVAAERCGRAPCSIASGRLSTLARMSRPIWVRYSTQPQPDGHDDGHAEGEQIVVRHVDVEEAQALLGEQQRHPVHLLRGPDPLGHPEDGDEEADRDDDPDRLGRVDESAHDPALDPHAERRCDDEHDRGERERDRPSPIDVQLPVAEGAQHRDRAVGEVEDAGGGVGEDEPARRQREDRGGGQPENGVAEEVLHGA